MVSKDIDSLYFGLSDVEKEGNWVWVNGEEVEYSNWDRGEPSRFTPEETYAILFVSGGRKWNSDVLVP